MVVLVVLTQSVRLLHAPFVLPFALFVLPYALSVLPRTLLVLTRAPTRSV
jgi:hypothetical protein